MTARAITLSLFVASFLAACASVAVPLPPAPRIGYGASEDQPPYQLEPSDVLELHILNNPDLNEQSIIGPDGRVTFQYAGNIPAGGHTLAELTDAMRKAYHVTSQSGLQVVLRSQAGQHIYVAGEVTLPSEVVANGPITAFGAITRAGGFKITAQQDEVVLVRRDEQNQPHLYAVNIASAQDGTDPGADVLLRPYDLLYVPRDRIANGGMIFEKLRNEVPFSGTFSFVRFLNSSNNQ